jgi:hypothetical protein
MGIRDKPAAPASPWQNGLVERLIGSIRRECVDHMSIRNLTTRKGLRAQSLHALFMAQTRTEMSAQRFADEMGRYCLRPDTPFGDKIKTEAGALYRLKRRTPDDALDQQKAGAPFIGNQSSASGSSGPSASSGLSATSATGNRNQESRP